MRAPALFTPQQRIGSDDGLVRAIELVVTPIVFAGLGYLADRALGTGPVLLIVFASVTLVGKVIAEWYRYDHRMKGIEAAMAKDRPTNARRLETPVEESTSLPTGVTLDSTPRSANHDQSEITGAAS